MTLSFNKNITIRDVSEVNSEVLKIELHPHENQVNISKLYFYFKCVEFTPNSIKI